MAKSTRVVSHIENPLALEEQVCFALSVAARTVVAVYRPVLAPMGLTHPQYLVMLALWEEQPLTVKKLSELLLVDSATLSPLVKRLEALELVTRQRDPLDERSLAISLTKKGRELRKQALNVPPTIVDKLGMDLKELHSLHQALMRVIAAAGEALDEADDHS
jgi:MarR family transcriptional regulator, organic hydroperoxide resistance regulator